MERTRAEDLKARKREREERGEIFREKRRETVVGERRKETERA